MKTTLSVVLNKGLFSSLAQVQRAKTKKQMIKELAKSIVSDIDMARGLRGKEDWESAFVKAENSAIVLSQAIDLAETVPGVKMNLLRAQADRVFKELSKVKESGDYFAPDAQDIVLDVERALENAAKALILFADKISSSNQIKSFDEKMFIKEYYDRVGLIEKKKKVFNPAGNIDSLIGWAGEVGFRGCVEALQDKSEITDPERVCGWLKARARERGWLAEEHKAIEEKECPTCKISKEQFEQLLAAFK